MRALNSNTLRAAAVGACAGFAGFLVGEVIWRHQGQTHSINGTDPLALVGAVVDAILDAAVWVGASGATIGAMLLAYDNLQGLRGRWDRDLGRGIFLFALLSFAGGAAGQFVYLLIQNSVTRAAGWALMGAGVGAGIGMLRGDAKQTARGALGGIIGGFIGGLMFDSLAVTLSQWVDQGDGYYSRCAGLVVTGMMIAAMMRFVQDSLKNAWLLGVSTPYEGREYPLNKDRVSVGRSEASDIALFREGALPEKLGAFVFQNGLWRWQGEPVEVNGKVARDIQLVSGDRLKLGESVFRFNLRGTLPVSSAMAPPLPSPAVWPASPASAGAAPAPPPWAGSAPAVSAAPNTATAPPPPANYPPAAPLPTVIWSLKPASGAALRLPQVAGPVTIGRDQSNTLVVSESSVSGFHARIVVQPRGLNIIDTDSTNGTFINERRLVPNTPQGLAAGDRLKLGAAEYVVERSG